MVGVSALGYITAQLFVVNALVYNESFTNDKDASRAFVGGYLDQHVSTLIDWKDVFADYVIKAKIHLVEGESFL